MKFLVTSDVHLSDKIWKHRPIEDDSYYSWLQIVQMAIDHEVSAIILAGDILDKQTNSSRPIKELLSGLWRLDLNDIDIIYNQGQHELQQMPWLAVGVATDWIQTAPLTYGGGWTLDGCDYKNTEKLQEFLKSERALNADILIMHQVWRDFMGDMCKPQGEFADIPENVRYLITGDYHEAICQKFGNLTVLSPGSTHLRSIAEPEDKSVFLMEVDESSSAAKIKMLPLVTRRLIQVKASSNPDFKKLKSEIESKLSLAAEYANEHDMPAALVKPLLHLVYNQDDIDVPTKVRALVEDRAHIFYKQLKFVSPESLEPSLVQHTDATDRVGMINCLDNYVDKSKNPQLFELASTLLMAPDPEQALHQWIKENTSVS